MCIRDSTRPAQTRSSVDLPQPLGPTRHRNSPAATSSEMRSRARTVPPCPLKATLTSLSWTLGRPPPLARSVIYPTPRGGATDPALAARAALVNMGTPRSSPMISLPWPAMSLPRARLTPRAGRPTLASDVHPLSSTVSRRYDATPTRPDREGHQYNRNTRLALRLRARRRPVVA